MLTPIAKKSRIEGKHTKQSHCKPAVSINCILFSSLKRNQKTTGRMHNLQQNQYTVAAKIQNKSRETYNAITSGTETDASRKEFFLENKEALQLESKDIECTRQRRHLEINILEISRERLLVRKE